MKRSLQQVKALTFDVFGTVVDYRGSIIREMRALAEKKGLDVDPAEFADAWRDGYQPAMQRVRTGQLPWLTIDVLHRMILDDLLNKFRITKLKETDIADLNRVWHRLKPWPDSVRGLKRLKAKFIIAPLSNGNVSLLTNMAKFGGLPWDLILSAELAKHYKPDPESYLTAARLLDLPSEQVMMVAAHKDDLDHAAKTGMQTAFITRPKEFNPDRKNDLKYEKRFGINASDFLDLADQLGV
jgi:2-haloacid dehalogenase